MFGRDSTKDGGSSLERNCSKKIKPSIGKVTARDKQICLERTNVGVSTRVLSNTEVVRYG